MLQSIRTFLTQATPAQRCLVATGIESVFILAFILSHVLILVVPEWRQMARPHFMLFAIGVLGSMLVVKWLTAYWLWSRRQSNQAIPRVYLILAVSTTLALTCEAFLAGNLTFPTNLLVVGLVPIGILILDVRSILVAVILGGVLLVANDVAILSGVLDYAPGYHPQAFGTGVHLFMIELLRTTIMYVGVVAYGVIAWILFDQYDYHRTNLINLSRLDTLTGLANRRYFIERLEQECERQKRSGKPMCLVMVDADHFKRINDTYGHLMGDAVLRGIAELLSRHMRVPADLPSRMGGEEFAILMPETELEGALKVCERVERSLQTLPFFCSGKSFTVTLSMGVVESRDLRPENLLHYADANLYKAKALGRDRIVATQEEEVLPHGPLASLA